MEAGGGGAGQSCTGGEGVPPPLQESGEDTGAAPMRTPPRCLPCPAQGEPLDLFSMEEAPAEYRRVAVEGAFDHARSQFVGPRTRTIAGSAKQAGWAAWAACKSVGRVRICGPRARCTTALFPVPASACCCGMQHAPAGDWVLARGGVGAGGFPAHGRQRVHLLSTLRAMPR